MNILRKTIILSDCHVGSKESNYKLLNKYIKNISCDELILAGDIWDIWDMPAKDIKTKYAKTISLLEGLAKSGVVIKFILGNHDEDYFDEPIASMDIIKVYNNVEILMPDGRKFAVIHGHEFDPIFKKWYTCSRTIAWINKLAKKWIGISTKTFKRETCTDLSGKKYSKIIKKIHEKAARTYKKLEYDGLIMGHTHSPTKRMLGGIEFINSGDWKWSNTYIEIEGNDIRLKKYDEEDGRGQLAFES